jgi:predicted nucleotidyltransferase
MSNLSDALRNDDSDAVVAAVKKILRPFVARGSLYLYGSRAAGMSDPDSDYDFAVISPSGGLTLKEKLDNAIGAYYTDRIDIQVYKSYEALASVAGDDIEKVS